MSWRDRYLKASYKDVSFFVNNHTFSGGINTANESDTIYSDKDIQKEYSSLSDVGFGRDTSNLVVSSEKRLEYSINAYIIGDDYDVYRDRLIAVLRLSESGILMHPYLGAQLVKAITWSVAESSKDGGIARFNITFQQDEDLAKENIDALKAKPFYDKYLKLVIDRSKQIANVDVPDHILTSETKFISKIIKTINPTEIKKRLHLTTAIDKYYSTLTSIKVIPALINVIEDIYINNPIAVYNSIRATLSAMSITSEHDYQNKAKLDYDKKKIASAVDTSCENIHDYDLYQYLQTMKSYYITIMHEKTASEIKTNLISFSTPWLVLVKHLYNNIDREQELINLNIGLGNPLFFNTSYFYYD